MRTHCLAYCNSLRQPCKVSRSSVFESLSHFSMICGRLSCSVSFFCHSRESYHQFVIGCFDLYGVVRAQPSGLFPRFGETVSRRFTWSFVSSSTFTESLQWAMSRWGGVCSAQADGEDRRRLLGGWVTVLVMGSPQNRHFLSHLLFKQCRGRYQSTGTSVNHHFLLVKFFFCRSLSPVPAEASTSWTQHVRLVVLP